MRTKRTNGTCTYEYVYLDGLLVKLTVNDAGTEIVMYSTYDASGTPTSILYDGTTYYYVTNLQGDVVGIVNQNGNIRVSYTYDAWGNLLSTTGGRATTVGKYNPLRYRGYVYDQETELYYLQSRYYNSEMGRFINADALVSTGQGLLGYNMFAYCNNNPTCNSDPTGELTDGQIHDSVLSAIILNYMISGYYHLSMTDTMIYYNGKNLWSGWGYCDLYDLQTGEVWELKKASNTYSCTTSSAKKQLGRYVNGCLASHPDLQLSRGGDLVFGTNTYTIKDSSGTYTITYWQECQGILRYSYTFEKDYENSQEAIQKARLACILVAAPIVVVGFCMAGGPAGAAASIPFVASAIALAA